MILVVVLLLLVLLSVIRKFFTRMSVIHSYHYQVDKELFLAAEGMYTGQSVYCGKKAEITDGAMFPMHLESNLATIAIVGENMKHTPGIAGKLFGTLGRSGISVIACAQGGSETNISFVVDSRFLRKSLNVLHDSFFLSEYKVLNLFIKLLWCFVVFWMANHFMLEFDIRKIKAVSVLRSFFSSCLLL